MFTCAIRERGKMYWNLAEHTCSDHSPFHKHLSDHISHIVRTEPAGLAEIGEMKYGEYLGRIVSIRATPIAPEQFSPLFKTYLQDQLQARITIAKARAQKE